MNDGCDANERDCEVALFNALYREHYRSLYAYLLGHTAEGETAADLLQETFVRVWRNRAQVRQVPPERRRFWLFAVARNIAADYHRRRAVRQRHEAALPETERAGDLAADPARTVEARETASAVDAAIARLPETLRTVLTLHLVGEMTSVEIGAALKKSPGTVRYQLAEARKRIARELGLQNSAGGGDEES
ncbi:MAG TPA: sigma-70 family RNA polymerase sigma factor [Chthonomonadaceae bacterium]|nr:sigma-70 family RNA polymerase sigma factor [Chthonomonadaceae bacterium]